jgi:hypothetical protein
MVNATPQLLYTPGGTPIPTVPETGWAWASMDKRKPFGPYRRSNPQPVAILKMPSWPITRDSWHHREFHPKMMKTGHINRNGFMAPSSLPPTVTDVRQVHKADQTKIQRGQQSIIGAVIKTEGCVKGYLVLSPLF